MNIVKNSKLIEYESAWLDLCQRLEGLQLTVLQQRTRDSTTLVFMRSVSVVTSCSTRLA